MGLSHNRLGLKGAGWARQENIDVMPVALEMAGVDMRLSPNAYRELHWHQVSAKVLWAPNLPIPWPLTFKRPQGDSDANPMPRPASGHTC